MNVCARQFVGSLMFIGGGTGVFIGIAYRNTILLAISPAFLLFGIFLSMLPIPTRRLALPYHMPMTL